MLIKRTKFDSSLIGYDGECVTQIIRELPEEIILRQACSLLFKRIEEGKTILRNPALELLLLLTGERELSRAKKLIGTPDEGYLFTCCKGEVLDSPTEIKRKETRIVLTRNVVETL